MVQTQGTTQIEERTGAPTEAPAPEADPRAGDLDAGDPWIDETARLAAEAKTARAVVAELRARRTNILVTWNETKGAEPSLTITFPVRAYTAGAMVTRPHVFSKAARDYLAAEIEARFKTAIDGAIAQAETDVIDARLALGELLAKPVGAS